MTALKVAGSLALLGYVLHNVDGRAALAVLREASWSYIALALMAKILALLVATVRWQFFVRDLGVAASFGQLWRANLVFNGVNQLMPTTIAGEVARYQRLATPENRRPLMASQALDKASMYLLTLAAAAAILASGDHVWPALSALLAEVAPAADLVAAGRIVIAGLLLISIAIWGAARGGVAKEGWQALAYNFYSWPRLWRHQAISLGFLGLLALCFFFCLRATGLEISPAICAMVFPLMAALGLLPISLSGFGLREAAAVTLIGPLMGQNHMILAGSVLFGLLALATSLPGLLLLWTADTQRP